MEIDPFIVCKICGQLSTPMRPGVCLDCHPLTVTFDRTGRWVNARGWSRGRWSTMAPLWWQERLNYRTRDFIRLLADTPLREHNVSTVELVADALGLVTVDHVGKLLMRFKEASVIDLAVTFPRAVDDDPSGDHGPKCGCKDWAFRLRPRPPAPSKPKRIGR